MATKKVKPPYVGLTLYFYYWCCSRTLAVNVPSVLSASWNTPGILYPTRDCMEGDNYNSQRFRDYNETIRYVLCEVKTWKKKTKGRIIGMLYTECHGE